jgi:type II secretion system protein J
LLELLLSLAIGALVLTLLYSLFHTALSAMRAKDGARSRSAEISDLLGILRDDLAMSVQPEGDGGCELKLESGTHGDPPEFHRLDLCTKEFTLGEEDLRWHHRVRVRYRAESLPAGIRLLQSRNPVVGPGSSDDPVTNVLIESVERLHIEFYDGDSWTGAWPPEETNTLPVAARMSLHVLEGGETRVYKTEIHLPSGTGTAPEMEDAP